MRHRRSAWSARGVRVECAFSRGMRASAQTSLTAQTSAQTSAHSSRALPNEPAAVRPLLLQPFPPQDLSNPHFVRS